MTAANALALTIEEEVLRHDAVCGSLFSLVGGIVRTLGEVGDVKDSDFSAGTLGTVVNLFMSALHFFLTL